MIKVITWNSHGLLYHRNLGVIIVNGRSISNLKKFGSCITVSVNQEFQNLLLFKKFAPKKFYLKQ